MQYERANVLFNIGAVLGQLAASQSRDTVDVRLGIYLPATKIYTYAMRER
jgi:hypothetical protein